MPVTLFSSTGALQFRPCRLFSHPVLVDADYLAASSDPDEVIVPPPRDPARNRLDRIRAGLAALLLFGILQAAALAPPLYMVRLFPS